MLALIVYHVLCQWPECPFSVINYRLLCHYLTHQWSVAAPVSTASAYFVTGKRVVCQIHITVLRVAQQKLQASNSCWWTDRLTNSVLLLSSFKAFPVAFLSIFVYSFNINVRLKTGSLYRLSNVVCLDSYLSLRDCDMCQLLTHDNLWGVMNSAE